MRRLSVAALLAVCMWAVLAVVMSPRLVASDDNREIAVTDDCDPSAAGGWGPGGCLRVEGSVTRPEFLAFLFSPLIATGHVPVGHPSWRIQPAFLAVEVGKELTVSNTGGRGHTFTEVAQYGGGFVAALNGTETGVAPECAAIATSPGVANPNILAPGASMEVAGLAVGNHKFQCCIHPWMRGDVKVVVDDDK